MQLIKSEKGTLERKATEETVLLFARYMKDYLKG